MSLLVLETCPLVLVTTHKSDTARTTTPKGVKQPDRYRVDDDVITTVCHARSQTWNTQTRLDILSIPNTATKMVTVVVEQSIPEQVGCEVLQPC